jgi:hypothetical protein
MKSVHLVIPDLILPKDFAAEASRGLRLPLLEKMLGRGRSEILDPVPLEDLLCDSFGMPYRENAPIALISAAFDGLGAGCWLRADPVHLRLQRDQMLLLPNTEISAVEAAEMCAGLNAHFAGQGMEFFAPHPQRWYLRLRALPRIRTKHLSQVIGVDVRSALPTGEEAAHWHRVFNEIQMLLFAHPLNESRDARGELTVNSLWFWGGGCDTLLMKPLATRLGEQTTPAKSLVMAKPADCGSSRQAAPTVHEEDAVANRGGGCDSANGSLRSSGEPVGLPLAGALLKKNYDNVSSDDVLAEMFANAADVPFSAWASQWRAVECPGKQLLVWTGLHSALQLGGLPAWQTALQDFENGYARPLWLALRSGDIAKLRIDIPGVDSMRRIVLMRGDTWAFWRHARSLADYSIV